MQQHFKSVKLAVGCSMVDAHEMPAVALSLLVCNAVENDAI